MYKALIDLPEVPETIVPTDLGETAEEKSAWARIAELDSGPDMSENVLADYVKKLKASRPHEMTEGIKRRIKEAEIRGDQAEADKLLQRLKEKRLTNGNS